MGFMNKVTHSLTNDVDRFFRFLTKYSILETFAYAPEMQQIIQENTNQSIKIILGKSPITCAHIFFSSNEIIMCYEIIPFSEIKISDGFICAKNKNDNKYQRLIACEKLKNNILENFKLVDKGEKIYLQKGRIKIKTLEEIEDYLNFERKTQ